MSAECSAETILPGYKQTEIGVIPEDWEVKPLKQISPRQCVGLVINPSSYFDDNGTVPMLVGSNIKENIIFWESANRITIDSNEMIASSKLAAGDLVTVRVGEPGTTAVVPPELDGCNCASMMIVRQHHSFNSLWLCYLMNSQIGLSQVKHVQYGTAQKQFNISDAINFFYPVPPLAEQEAIANALSDADAFIESLEQLIAKKRQIKQGAMQELLTGERRLPEFIGEWEISLVKSIGEIHGRVGWKGYTKKDLVSSGPYTIGAKHIDDSNRLDLSDPTYLSFDKYIESPEIMVQKNDILIVQRGTIGKLVLIDRDIGDATINPSMVILRLHNICPKFVFYFLTSRNGQKQITSDTSSTGVPMITQKQIENFQIYLPPSEEEQTAIATILSDIDSEITALEEKLAKARQIKQGMMQELLMGRIRLV